MEIFVYCLRFSRCHQLDSSPIIIKLINPSSVIIFLKHKQHFYSKLSRQLSTQFSCSMHKVSIFQSSTSLIVTNPMNQVYCIFPYVNLPIMHGTPDTGVQQFKFTILKHDASSFTSLNNCCHEAIKLKYFKKPGI